jgi:hypothetical protein
MKKYRLIFFFIIVFVQTFSLYSQEASSKDYTLRSWFSNNFTTIQSGAGTNLVNSAGENYLLSISKSSNFLLLSGTVPIRLMPVATIYNTPSKDTSRKLLKSPIALPPQCQGSETILIAEGGGGYIFRGSDSSKGYIWNTSAVSNSVQVFPLGDSVIKVQAKWGDLAKNYSFISAPDSVLLSTIKLKANIDIKDLSMNPASEKIGGSSIDLILVSDSNLAICTPDEIQYSLKFNRTLFKPIDNPTDYIVLSDSIDGNFRIYRIKKTISAGSLTPGNIISSIKGTVLLGNTDVDSASFVTKNVPSSLQNYTKFYSDGGKTFNIEWFKNGSPYFVDTKVSSGKINLDSICIRKNVKRLLDWPPPTKTYLNIVSISPNPSDLLSSITIETNSSDNLTLSIYSLDGILIDKQILKLDAPNLIADELINITATVNTGNLSNGAYFIMVSSNESHTSKYLIISR